MPPKKGGKDKKGGKGKGKKDADPGDAELGPAELLVQAKLRIESLERQLVWREEKLQGALSAQRELKQQVDNYHADFEREKTEIFDISADMTRQYKGMQEELLARLNTLENQIASQKDQLEMSGIQLEEVRAEKAQELAKKDAEIAEQQLKMEDMAVEFGEMLKETLEKMSERIEITNSSWDSGTGEQAARRLEEFKLSNMGAE
uniref:Dynein regulatory complex protein 12 n=1 Tax=Prymnesium polylepis TaxID=72548 RepID=A0A7S4I427_9EUKA|mmetsp:Transcript_68195/g.186900  ORF Transcript_68195/g.186900 Transcript_68195/m.186900 type:complete len:204 (+) Transcript_68195:135-746(+)